MSDWKQYAPGVYDRVNKEFWDAFRKVPTVTDMLHLGVVRIHDKWCAYATLPSRFGDPAVSHGGATDFDFSDRASAIERAEALGLSAIASWLVERKRQR